MISDLWVADKFKTIIWWGSFTWDYRWDRINRNKIQKQDTENYVN